MIRTRLIFALAVTAALLSTAQNVATTFYSVRPVEWYFTPSHILGGVFIALLILYFADGFSVRPELYMILGTALLVGVAWEILEYALHLYSPAWDSLSDLVADTAGGYLGWLIARHISQT